MRIINILVHQWKPPKWKNKQTDENLTPLPRNTSSWKTSFVVRRRSSKDRSRLGRFGHNMWGSGYWGGVIHWAKSLNSSGLSMCVCVCHDVRFIMIIWWVYYFMKHSVFSHSQVNRHQLRDAMPLTTPGLIHHPSTIISKKTSHSKVFLLRRYLGRVCQVLWNHVATMLRFFPWRGETEETEMHLKSYRSFSAMRV